MGWTHRATWDDRADTDRTVFKDGKRVGRIYFLPHGPQSGKWQWSGFWIGPNHSGVVESLETALTTIKDAYLDVESNHPHRLIP